MQEIPGSPGGHAQQKFLDFQEMEKFYSKSIHQMTSRPDWNLPQQNNNNNNTKKKIELS